MSQNWTPLVSVITPTYQHEKFIGPCIESVLGQSYSNWEQIIIDDGSTDSTGHIVRRYNDPRIHYVYQANQGPFALSHTYNRALALAKGELIAILEGDDLWPPTKLATLIPAFVDSTVVVAHGQVRDVSPDGVQEKRMSRTSRLRNSLSHSVLSNDPVGSATRYMLLAKGTNLVMPSTAIIRRQTLEDIGGFQYVEDLPLTDYPTFLELSLRGRFFYVFDIMGYRRLHYNSVTIKYAESVQKNNFKFALEFLEKHRDQIQFTAAETEEMKRGWEGCRPMLEFTQARVLAAQNKWLESRPLFRVAMRSKDIAVALAATTGLLLSYVHFTIEPIMKLAGRIDPRVDAA